MDIKKQLEFIEKQRIEFEKTLAQLSHTQSLLNINPIQDQNSLLKNTIASIKNNDNSIINRIQQANITSQNGLNLDLLLKRYKEDQLKFYEQLKNTSQLTFSIKANNYVNQVINTINSSVIDVKSIIPSVLKFSIYHSNLVDNLQKQIKNSSYIFSPYPTSLQFLKTLKSLDYILGKNLSEEYLDEETLKILANEQKIEDSLSLEDLINSLDKNLIYLWQGALFAFSSYDTNPDFVRHLSSSLRELLQRIIDTLAPKEDIISWIQKEKIEEDKIYVDKDKNKIKRIWKLAYIYRNNEYQIINKKDYLIKFYDQNIECNIQCLKINIRKYDENVHSLINKEKIEELRSMIDNIKSIIISLIQLTER